MFKIRNDRGKIMETCFFDTEIAQRGFFYLSGNAATWRLLVPDLKRDFEAEMKKAKYVEMEITTIGGRPSVILWFEDGTETSFFIALETKMIDRKVEPSRSKAPLLIYDRDGLQMELTVRRILGKSKAGCAVG